MYKKQTHTYKEQEGQGYSGYLGGRGRGKRKGQGDSRYLGRRADEQDGHRVRQAAKQGREGGEKKWLANTIHIALTRNSCKNLC